MEYGQAHVGPISGDLGVVVDDVVERTLDQELSDIGLVFPDGWWMLGAKFHLAGVAEQESHWYLQAGVTTTKREQAIVLTMLRRRHRSCPSAACRTKINSFDPPL